MFGSKFGLMHVPTGGTWQVKRFPHPHGMTSTISKAVLITIEMKVRTAHPIPILPILSAITSSFFYK
jgi:hypothetical protein